VILTVSLGTMVGCSAAGEETEAEPVPEQPAQEEMSAQSAPAEASPGDDQTPEDTTTLTFFKEGEPEEKQAVPALGDGYLLFLPDGEWQQSDADTWTSAVNDQVRLWIAHFADKSMDAVDQELSADGYATEDYALWQKQEDDLIYHMQLSDFGADLWGVFYCYPADAEEGFGRELPLIADTFTLSF